MNCLFCPAAALPENADTTFIEGGIQELLRARRVLRASYAYGYFLTGNSDKKAIFESMQVDFLKYWNILGFMFSIYRKSPSHNFFLFFPFF